MNDKRIIEEFFELTRISSVSKNERKLADCLKRKLENLGLEVFEDDAGSKIGGNARNIFAFYQVKPIVKLYFSPVIWILLSLGKMWSPF